MEETHCPAVANYPMADAFVGEENYRAPELFRAFDGGAPTARKGQVEVRPMYISHIHITIPKNGESAARRFYGHDLGLPELPKPKSPPGCGGLWFNAGGLTLHISVTERRAENDRQAQFGLGCGDVEGLKARLKAAGKDVEDGPSLREKRFFVRDPFGNRIEIHEPGVHRG